MRPSIVLTGLGTALVLCVFVLLPEGRLAAAKPSPPPNWPCSITFRDTLDYTDPIGGPASEPTAVQSDGLGPYDDGTLGVQCLVNRAPASGNYGNLFVNVDAKSLRYLWFPGQAASNVYTRSGYGSFENRQPGYFEIARIDTVTTVDMRRRIRVGVGYALDFDGGEMWGDSLSSDPLVAGSASAWVTPTAVGPAGACRWELRVFPRAALEAGDMGAIASSRVLALREGPARRRLRTADFELPLSATVTLRAGVNGCP
jgi:hypothetical protein